MIVSEEEAKTKRCCGPEGCGEREGRPEHKHALRLSAIEVEAATVALMPRMCIGSACMAWRWAQKPNPDFQPMSAWPTLPHANLYLEDRERGYCGYAGG